MAQEKKPLPEGDSGQPFLAPRQAAAFLRCSPSTVLKWRQRGLLAPKRAWTREELLAAARKNAERPPSASGRRGLKLDLPQAAKKKTSDDGVGPTKKGEKKGERGFLAELASAFDFDDDFDDDKNDDDEKGGAA